MAQTINKSITVQELTRYGVKVDGVYVNWSKFVTPEQKAVVVPGGVYDVEVYVADSGKEYINKVTSKTGLAAVTAVVEKIKKDDTPKYAPKSDTMSKEEWASKDLRISRQGVIQAAVQAVAPLVSLELLYPEAEKLALQMLDFVNQKKAV